MQSAASLTATSTESSWRVSREGAVVAVVDVRHEGGSVVVSAGPVTAPKPHTFGSLQAAEGFLSDLLTSFAYLGCEVARV